MAPHIRNAETEELAETLARVTGETETDAVRRAPRERLQRVQAHRTREPERRAFNEAIERADERCLSVASFVETSIVLDARYGAEALLDLDRFLCAPEFNSLSLIWSRASWPGRPSAGSERGDILPG